MSRHPLNIAILSVILTAVPALARAVPGPERVTATYLYDLSNSDGTVASSWASLSYDPAHKELFVVDKQDGTVGIFNDVGMETYRLGEDSDIGTILSVAVADDGDLLVLASATRGPPIIHRCNFRGEPKDRIVLDLPQAFAAEFWPDTLVFRAGKMYLAQKGQLKVVIADLTGKCLAIHDFYREMKLDQAKSKLDQAKSKFDQAKSKLDQAKSTSRVAQVPAMHAFNVDDQGNMLFTIAPLFQVFVVSPEGKVASFGERGGAPGKFNITGGVARDAQGNFYVSDLLKCAVLVFSPEFEFLGQFGERGWDRGDFIAPLEVSVADGKLYVSQSARRGVSVFQVKVAPPPPPPPATAEAPAAP
jgi:hypothetical protein